MRGPPVPSLLDLKGSYEKLDPGISVSEMGFPSLAELGLYSRWSRFDARLGELIVRFLAEQFDNFDPVALRKINQSQPMSEAMGVILEFARLRLNQGQQKTSSEKPGLEKINRLRYFDLWSKLVMADIPKAEPQLFFVTDGMTRPERALRVLARSLKPYLNWGFFGDQDLAALEKLFAQRSESGSVTLLPAKQRARLLESFLEEHSRFRVADYVEYCGGKIHPRTAERDLANSSRVRRVGETRGAVYVRRGRLT